ncbi:uncharacterized protein LOC131673029 [Phymastichus coffea]|uniref:uncharacterized protein LOC131673029 n=1 Tax=Phymastichus coffea TaxID=108790 RepID=UPI00273AF39F|nr:uncharacterized protein LOC131673029 [Phymastichus coffea]
MEDGTTCTICGEPLENNIDTIVQVHCRGLKTFIDKNKSREDEKHILWEGKESVNFHESCRKRYSALKSTSKRKRESSIPSLYSPTTSNDSNDFNFDEYCFICNKLLDRYHKKVSTLQHLYTYQNILKVASTKNDELGGAVWNRLRNMSFKEKFFQYHYVCYINFWHNPSKVSLEEEHSEQVTDLSDEEPVSSNFDIERDRVIDNICSYIEKSGKFQFTLSKLHGLNEKKIRNKLLCNRLQDKYNDDIFILKHPGREIFIYYKKINFTQICSDWVNKKSISDFEKNAVINFATEILRSEILNAKYQNSLYPPAEKFLDNVNSEIPQLLKNFLDGVLNSKGRMKSVEENQEKIDMIAHSIVTYTRPRAFLSNLQLALGLYVYRKTGSRIVIDLLSKFGVCASYSSIQLYEASTIINSPIHHVDSAFVQFIFDNTDHNVGTLDGRETFHCLGGVT